MKRKVLVLVLPTLLIALTLVPMVAFAAPVAPVESAAASYDVVPAYDIAYTMAYSLNVDIDTQHLFDGAQIMLDALSAPYLLIAGFGLGVAILGAIMRAVTRLRIG